MVYSWVVNQLYPTTMVGFFNPPFSSFTNLRDSWIIPLLFQHASNGSQRVTMQSLARSTRALKERQSMPNSWFSCLSSLGLSWTIAAIASY